MIKLLNIGIFLLILVNFLSIVSIFIKSEEEMIIVVLAFILLIAFSFMSIFLGLNEEDEL